MDGEGYRVEHVGGCSWVGVAAGVVGKLDTTVTKNAVESTVKGSMECAETK